MNLARTSITVDKCTPRDRYARTQVSFPTSIITNTTMAVCADDFLLDWPLNKFYVPDLDAGTRRRSRSYAPRASDSYETSPASTPSLDRHHYRHIDRAQNPVSRYLESGPTPQWDGFDHNYHPHSPEQNGLSTFFDQSESTHDTLADLDQPDNTVEFDFDRSCLDTLDEQLLRSPTDSFFDVCWSTAVEDEVPVPVLEPVPARSHAKRRGKYASGASASVTGNRTVEMKDRHWLNRAPAMMEACAHSIPSSPTSLTSPSSPHSSIFPASPPGRYYDATPASPTTHHYNTILASESRLPYHNPNDSVHFFPVPVQHARRQRRKTNATALSNHSTTSVNRSMTAFSSRTAPSVKSGKSGKSSSTTATGALKIISNACSVLTRTNRKRAKSTV
ncbi:hypothetical protein BJ138DRAFT_937757 [Hygrophoropsis aurantiaca]|uniref:Uncharacterized protein n=1 Tax=Hygrophoropsis aurantiaca TaxID=72124 RepID=A0ACB8ADX7_9AGAM|nr:hypothetical protein BJ138DRAFT_937757 [Hygrophoropsis aurantiaca]